MKQKTKQTAAQLTKVAVKLHGWKKPKQKLAKSKKKPNLGTCDFCNGRLSSPTDLIRLSFPQNLIRRPRVSRKFCSWTCTQKYFLHKGEVPTMPVFGIHSD